MKNNTPSAGERTGSEALVSEAMNRIQAAFSELMDNRPSAADLSATPPGVVAHVQALADYTDALQDLIAPLINLADANNRPRDDQ